mgnify:CR=1 FL=1
MVKAKQAYDACLQLCTRFRKKKLKKFTNMLTKKNYSDLYSELELHAELVYAVVTGCYAILSLITCHTVKRLAKIGYYIAIALNIFG